jgi:quercetin dioxygenase-like cupin family protein
MIKALDKPKCVEMPSTEHHFSDGLYAKELLIPKGMGIVQHTHKYAHLSILAKGRVIVTSDDEEQE